MSLTRPQGQAKAWVYFNGTGTVAKNGDFNVTSITDNGVGSYTVNFTQDMPNTNYVITGSALNSKFEIASGGTWTVSGVGIWIITNASTVGVDTSRICVAVFGDAA